MRPRLLDLFCGAGGCSVGYARAGFDVVGVDLHPQPNYPYRFFRDDALVFLEDVVSCIRQGDHGYSAIHASPPCQAYSQAAQGQRTAGKVYPDLLGPTRELLEATGLPWVIENVPGAPMRADYRICGCQVGLKLRRVRWFETSWHGFQMSTPCHHTGPVVSVVGHGTPSWVREQLGFNPSIADYREAMGIDWMNRNELSQAIPPAYTELIGHQLLAHVTPPRDQLAAKLREDNVSTDENETMLDRIVMAQRALDEHFSLPETAYRDGFGHVRDIRDADPDWHVLCVDSEYDGPGTGCGEASETWPVHKDAYGGYCLGQSKWINAPLTKAAPDA